MPLPRASYHFDAPISSVLDQRKLIRLLKIGLLGHRISFDLSIKLELNLSIRQCLVSGLVPLILEYLTKTGVRSLVLILPKTKNNWDVRHDFAGELRHLIFT
jgi:hypothetical protein